MSIMDKLKKNSKIKETSTLSTSKFFTEKDMVPTDVPMVNVALSGSVNGGIAPGLTVLAGPSKHFKTSFALLMAGAYLNAKPEAVVLFYDSEFGSPQSYFEQFGVDTDRVLHTPIANVEELKFDLINQLEELDRDDDVMIIIDSIGNLASKKELEDALNEKGVADMSRAKAAEGSVPYDHTLLDNEKHSVGCNQPHLQRDRFVSKRYRRWWYRYLLLCGQHLDSGSSTREARY